MKIQTKRIIAGLGLAAGLVAASNVSAETATINASVVVDGSLNVSVLSPLDYGTIAAIGHGVDVATLTISSDPAVAPAAVNTANAKIIIIVDGTPADVLVSNAAPMYALTVTPPAATTATDPSTVSAHTFDVDNFSMYAHTEGNSQTFGTTTDATGNLGFNIGADLITDTAVVGAYDNTTYTSTFDYTINY